MTTKSTLFKLFSIQLIFIAFLLLANGSDSFGVSRQWPIPAFPPEIVEGNIPTDPMRYIELWQDYIVYLAIIFISPIIFTLLAIVFVAIASVCRCCAIIIPSPLMKKNMSATSIRILGLIPFAIAYAILFVATAFGIGFFAWFFIGIINLRKTGFDVLTDTLQLPTNLVAGVSDIADEVPNVMTNFANLINDVVDIQDTVDEILGHINDTKSALGGIEPYLDNNFAKYTEVKNIQMGMVARTSGADEGISAVDFTAFDSIFQNSTASISNTINSTLDTIYDQVEDATSHLTTGISQINGHISSINSTVVGTINNIRSIVDAYVQGIEEYYIQYLNSYYIDLAKFIIQIVEIVVAILIACIIPIVLIIMTTGFLWIFLRCCCCLACLDCCACLSMIMYGVIGGVCFVVWFLSVDACGQVESFFVRNEDYYNVKPFTFSTPTGTNISVKYSDAILGVVKCSGDTNYLDATGFSIEAFDIPNYISGFEQPLKDAINQFDVASFVSSMSSQLTDVVNSINIADNFEASVDQLKSVVTSTVTTYFGLLDLSISDFENHDTTLDELNAILTSYSLSPLTGSTVGSIAPFGYASPTPLPGRITEAGGDQNFPAYYSAVTDAGDKNTIWGSYARDNSNNEIAPGSIESGLVFRLTKMNAGDPLYIMETYTDYVDLLVAYDELTQSVNDTEVYAKSILDFEPVVNNITLKVNNTMDEVFNSVRDYVYTTIDDLIYKVTSLDILRCGNIGKLYTTFESSICGNFQIAVGGISLTSLSAVLIMILIMLVLFHAQCLSRRKKKNFLDDDDDEDNYDGKIENMEKTINSIRSSSVPPQYGFLGTQYYAPAQ